MKNPLRVAAAVLLLLVGGWLAVSWMEAEKEVRVLCAQFAPGDSLRDVIRQLDTGNYLQYVVRGEGRSITFHSVYNLRTTRCSVQLEEGIVRQSRYHD